MKDPNDNKTTDAIGASYVSPSPIKSEFTHDDADFVISGLTLLYSSFQRQLNKYPPSSAMHKAASKELAKVNVLLDNFKYSVNIHKTGVVS